LRDREWSHVHSSWRSDIEAEVIGYSWMDWWTESTVLTVDAVSILVAKQRIQTLIMLNALSIIYTTDYLFVMLFELSA
jgi:hypothetical protein